MQYFLEVSGPTVREPDWIRNRRYVRASRRVLIFIPLAVSFPGVVLILAYIEKKLFLHCRSTVWQERDLVVASTYRRQIYGSGNLFSSYYQNPQTQFWLAPRWKERTDGKISLLSISARSHPELRGVKISLLSTSVSDFSTSSMKAIKWYIHFHSCTILDWQLLVVLWEREHLTWINIKMSTFFNISSELVRTGLYSSKSYLTSRAVAHQIDVLACCCVKLEKYGAYKWKWMH